MSGNGLFMLGEDLARMPEEQRAEWRKDDAHHRAGKGRQIEAAGFDAVRFHSALTTAARQLGVKTQRAVAAEVGVQEDTITRMKRGLAPSLATCLLLCDWAGLNPLDYLLRLAPAAANDSTARAAA